MTEYEIATIAFQEATIAFQDATLASRAIGHWIAIGQIAATLAIGLGQIGIVWYGIRAMNRASAERARDRKQAELDRRQAARIADQRHTETMSALDLQRQALETLIARTAPAAR